MTIKLYEKSKKLQYQAKWTEHNNDLIWYNVVNFNENSHCLWDFHKCYLDKSNSLKNLNYWMKCWKKDEEIESWLNNNKLAK